MFELNAEGNILEGVLQLSDCERSFIVKWLSGSSQAAFYIGDGDDIKEKVSHFIIDKRNAFIDSASFKKYLKEIKMIVEKYRSMYYGPFDRFNDVYNRYINSTNNIHVVLSYDYANKDRYVRILNDKKGKAENEPVFGLSALRNGDDFRNTFVGLITKASIIKEREEYLIKISVIENWREEIMKANNSKVNLESIVKIFNDEMDDLISNGHSKQESAQVFGIKFAPLLNANSKKFTADDVLGASKFLNDGLSEYLKNGMKLSPSVLWNSGVDKIECKKFDFDSSNIKDGKNLIVYGTPGCGKSYYVEHVLLNGYKPENRIRTTFFQDYTNTDFVGQILPVVDEKKNVTYDFHPGPFTLALEKAIECPNEKVALIIEELNRGSAASIFGDIFQLLDRKNGVSEYEIINVNIINYLNDQFAGRYSFDSVKLPGNLSIFATMNTCDQNVFTLDTAFKRRWEFKKITNKFSDDHSFRRKFIPGANITWEELVNDINEYILSNSDGLNSEDKQIGVYFVDPTGMRDSINDQSDEKARDAFAYKIFEYLWDDVAKFQRDKWFGEDIKSLDELIEKYKEKGTDVFNDGIIKKQ